ncbi:hypothetical protein GCM10022199_22690 [Marihabitans asiaticum]|uniref:Glyoxalase-like domain-containing protein n=1 Tax=Marihabitans asiaticum TaxID=415218 RepID=A0A560WA54_9MICO|nr:VOC family protein [Marihabitans asiaticum]TWD14507.1 hypothetical protein FB557_1919 [Marihabitans asiaticum]
MDHPLPRLRQTVLDAENVRELAEFYRQLLGLVYREEAEPPTKGEDDADWLNLRYPDGSPALAFQQVDRAVSLGGRVLLDRSDDPEEPLFVVADPAGHPFCLFVA